MPEIKPSQLSEYLKGKKAITPEQIATKLTWLVAILMALVLIGLSLVVYNLMIK